MLAQAGCSIKATEQSYEHNSPKKEPLENESNVILWDILKIYLHWTAIPIVFTVESIVQSQRERHAGCTHCPDSPPCVLLKNSPKNEWSKLLLGRSSALIKKMHVKKAKITQ